MVRNPLIIGAIAGVLAYSLIYAKQRYYDGKDKVNVQLHIPIIVALIAWFTSSNVPGFKFNYNSECYDPGYDVTNIISISSLDHEKIFADLAAF